MFNHFGAVLAARELAKSRRVCAFLDDALTAFAVGVLVGAYVGLVVYAAGAYLGLL